MYRQCLALRERVLGKDHPGNASTLDAIAKCLTSMRKHGEALAVYQSCLDLQERVLGKDHSDCITTIAHIADCESHMAQSDGVASVPDN